MASEPWSLRNLLLREYSFLLVISAPVIAFAIILLVNHFCSIPPNVSADVCQTETTSPASITARVSVLAVGIGLEVTLPKSAAVSAKPINEKTSSTICGANTTVEQADMAQARTLTVIAFTTAILVLFLVYYLGILPDKSLIDLFNLLGPKDATHGKFAKSLAKWGASAEIAVAVFYIAAMAAIACPLTSRPYNDEELARRFERLTSLSTLGSLGFALGVITLCAMVAWPLSIHKLNKDFTDAETPLVALFGLELTVVLVAAYFPTAMILSARADEQAELARDKVLGEPTKEFLDVIKTKGVDCNPDVLGKLAKDLWSIASAQARNSIATPQEAAWLTKQDWRTKRGLTLITTPRLITAVGTLLPLIAGAVTSASSASSAVALLLK